MIFDRRYVFEGEAIAVATTIHRIGTEQVDINTCTEGSACLPPNGGCLYSKSPGVEFRQGDTLILSHKGASSTVQGVYVDRQAAVRQTQGQLSSYRIPTHVTCQASLTKLNLQNRVLADALSSELIAEDPRNGGQPRFSAPALPSITNLTVDKLPVEIEFDDVFFNLSTIQAVVDEYKHSAAFRKQYGDRFFRTDQCGCDDDQAPTINGYIIVSVVKEFTFPQGKPPGVTVNGNVLIVPDFGQIHCGEMIISTNTRLLTVLRFQLGSPFGGSAICLVTKPGGHCMP